MKVEDIIKKIEQKLNPNVHSIRCPAALTPSMEAEGLERRKCTCKNKVITAEELAVVVEKFRQMETALKIIAGGTEDITPPFRYMPSDNMMRIAQAALKDEPIGKDEPCSECEGNGYVELPPTSEHMKCPKCGGNNGR